MLPTCSALGFSGRTLIRQRLGEDELVPRPLELGLLCELQAMAVYGIRREMQSGNITDAARMLVLTPQLNDSSRTYPLAAGLIVDATPAASRQMTRAGIMLADRSATNPERVFRNGRSGFIAFLTAFLSEDDIFQCEGVIADELVTLTSNPLRVGRLEMSISLRALGSDGKQLNIEAQVVGGSSSYRCTGLSMPVTKFAVAVRDPVFFRDLSDIDAAVQYSQAWRADRVAKHVAAHGQPPRDADVRLQEREIFGGLKPDAHRPFLCEASERMRAVSVSAVKRANAAAAAADAAAAWLASQAEGPLLQEGQMQLEVETPAADTPLVLDLEQVAPILIKVMHDLKVGINIPHRTQAPCQS